MSSKEFPTLEGQLYEVSSVGSGKKDRQRDDYRKKGNQRPHYG